MASGIYQSSILKRNQHQTRGEEKRMPNTPEKVIDRAEELCILCEEDEAERIVREALEMKPNHLGLQTELAIILSRKGYDTKAEGILRKVIKQDPYHQRAIAALGRMLDNSLRSDEAETLFTIFLKKRPDAHIVFDDLCRLWFDNEEQEKALEAARKHITEYPNAVHAYDALRFVLVRLEDDLSSDLADDPTDHERIIAFSKNILEQYSILMKLKDMVTSSQEADKYHEDLEEDLRRIKGELLELRKRYQNQHVPISKELDSIFEHALSSE